MSKPVPKQTPPKPLDKEKIKLLMVNADIAWFEKHDGAYDYRGHVEFAAEYIAKNYGRMKKKC